MNDTGLTRDLFAGVNRPTDFFNLTDLERKHIPSILAPATVRRGQCFEVTIEVGKSLPHPNDRKHFIEFVELYADGFLLARVDMTAVNVLPKVILSVCLTGPAEELRAYARCNIHGTWVGTSPITTLG